MKKNKVTKTIREINEKIKQGKAVVVTAEEIIDHYPKLAHEDILAALAYGGLLSFKGRPIVRSYDPRKWPCPPEPDCQEEWNETKK